MKARRRHSLKGKSGGYNGRTSYGRMGDPKARDLMGSVRTERLLRDHPVRGKILDRNPIRALLIKKVARLVLMGKSIPQIGQIVHFNETSLYRLIHDQTFLTYLEELEKDLFRTVDRRISLLLVETINTLRRLLRHRDWQANIEAVDRVLRMHGRYIEKLDVSGKVEHEHSGTVGVVGAVGHIGEAEMTDEMREHARALLRASRKVIPLHASKVTTGPSEEE